MIASNSMQMPAASLSRRPAAHDGTPHPQATSCRHGKGTTMQIVLVGLGRMGANMSRGEADFADRVLSAMRFGFGGHEEQKG
jgi:hypothetical protein